MRNPSIDAVEQALYVDRSLVRHHAMRRTLWVMSPRIARLAHGAATAKVARAERKRTLAAFADSSDIEDAERWLDDAVAEIVQLLEQQGPLPTRAIGAALDHLVVPVVFGAGTKHPAEIKAHTKVLQGAGFDATILRGPPTGSWIASEYLWAPTEHWLRAPIAGADEGPAAAELLDRWLRCFGPATETDITWWFGWTLGLTRKSLAAIDAEQVDIEGLDGADNGVGFVAAGDTELPKDPGPWVRLLPGLDPTSMGWKERDWYIDAGSVPRLFDRFGNVGPTVWADGAIVGGWVQRPDGEVAVEPTVDLDARHRALLDEAIDELRTGVGDVVVRPRFPAPAQTDLYTG